LICCSCTDGEVVCLNPETPGSPSRVAMLQRSTSSQLSCMAMLPAAAAAPELLVGGDQKGELWASQLSGQRMLSQSLGPCGISALQALPGGALAAACGTEVWLWQPTPHSLVRVEQAPAPVSAFATLHGNDALGYPTTELLAGCTDGHIYKVKTHKCQSELCDRFELYNASVCAAPEEMVEFMEARFQEAYGRSPVRLREDFCGTSEISNAWVASAPDRISVCVDNCGEVLAWTAAHSPVCQGGLKEATSETRLALVQADVTDSAIMAAQGSFDVILANNFSWMGLKTSQELLSYFTNARAGLAEHGLFILDIYGGPGAMAKRRESLGWIAFTRTDTSQRAHCRAVWEQIDYDDTSQFTHTAIHYEFVDGSRLTSAFEYYWHLYTVGQTIQALRACGFKHIRLFVEPEDCDDCEEWKGSLSGTLDEVDKELHSLGDWFSAQIIASPSGISD